MKTNKLRFFKMLGKSSKPLKTLNKVKNKRHDDCNEKKTHQYSAVDASVKHNGKYHEQNYL